MAKHERSAAGQVPSGNKSNKALPDASNPSAPDGRLVNRFWVSHNKWQFHRTDGGCEPTVADNVGYSDDAERVIDQGFSPCPKCLAD